MGSVREYFLSVVLCTLSCGIFSQIISNPRKKALMRLISGTILAITILQPLSHINKDLFGNISVPIQPSAACYIAEGETVAMEAQKRRIQSACEAYILSKAEALDIPIAVRIVLDENLIPDFAEIIGETDPDIKRQLENILMVDLGIPKENQIWTWNRESNGS